MRSIILHSLIVFSSLTIYAQDKSFTVEVSSDSILIGNYIEVKFILLNIDGELKTPEFDGVNIVGGPNQSSSMSSINGDVRQQKSISYFLEPTDLGEIFIAPAFVSDGENDWETTPLKLFVLPNPEGIIERPSMTQKFNFEFGDLFENNDFFGQDDLFPERKTDDTKPSKPKVKKRKI